MFTMFRFLSHPACHSLRCLESLFCLVLGYSLFLAGLLLFPAGPDKARAGLA